ncbi:autotransporter secretion outer membrane protein TamA [Faunimonas pinastri]|uniref:Autotransporter secretion outer membrane protein TamA n=1 Tax=Faunimonas pinastri TaxID=1855383 RepID=A0A1H9D5V3_9HYPH|nr:autotransporter assembly complex family protein [Faunimonas pinastri]SEQ08835.1 autotransporter secretion outer membrane protein TamA [Faunimonas pinastri]
MSSASPGPRHRARHRNWQRAACVTLALAVTVPLAPAEAFTLFGHTFFGKNPNDPANAPDAQPYKIDFNLEGQQNKRLKRVLQSASNLFTQRRRPPAAAAGLIARAKGDYGRILAALYTQGYYGGTIRILVDGRDPATIAPDSTLPKPSQVTVSVDPGPLFQYGTVQFDGLPAPIPMKDKKAELDLRDAKIQHGAVARSGEILTAEKKVIDVWRQRGYPKARVADRKVVADHATNQVNAVVEIDHGPAAVFGPVSVTGTQRLDPAFAVRQTGLHPGDRYDPDDLARAKKRLQRLDTLSSISIKEADVVRDGTLPITFNLAERKRHLVGGGVSYSTRDGADVTGYFEYRNIFGRGEKFRLDAEVGGLGADSNTRFKSSVGDIGSSFDTLDYKLSGTFTRPGTFSPDTDLVLNVTGQQEYVDTYLKRGVGGTATLKQYFTDELTGSLGVELEKERVEDALGINNYLIFGIPGQLEFDNRDVKLNPTEGFHVTGDLEPFTDLEGGTIALSSKISAATYKSLDANDRFIVAGRVALGSIVGGSNLEDIPADRRFYIGGGGSVRGYDYKSVGPRVNGDIVGGKSFWEASLELRTKITESIGIVPFFDLGNAYEDSIPDFSGGVKMGAGLGLRYNTGLGPIRLDVAVPLNPVKGDAKYGIYVGLGQAF